ncbi:MAG: tail fiber domain-containing protein, partial [Planctomycetota bacterium]
TYSSIRWKENISEINSDEALAKIMQLKPVHFKWKEEYGNNSDTGFIAEDVGEVIPEAVEWNGEHAEGLSTAQIIAYLTKVVQSQQEEIEKQWVEIEALKSKLNTGQ